mmetsp:Transcript_54108/g.161968  ORF Transcript_54108/g.161968 Transcript_54108/m.161968 type:complete len:160 (-) Transcript_54108:998-1477(-)
MKSQQGKPRPQWNLLTESKTSVAPLCVKQEEDASTTVTPPPPPSDSDASAAEDAPEPAGLLSSVDEIVRYMDRMEHDRHYFQRQQVKPRRMLQDAQEAAELRQHESDARRRRPPEGKREVATAKLRSAVCNSRPIKDHDQIVIKHGSISMSDRVAAVAF